MDTSTSSSIRIYTVSFPSLQLPMYLATIEDNGTTSFCRSSRATAALFINAINLLIGFACYYRHPSPHHHIQPNPSSRFIH